jgi:hypothetical protein
MGTCTFRGQGERKGHAGDDESSWERAQLDRTRGGSRNEAGKEAGNKRISKSTRGSTREKNEHTRESKVVGWKLKVSALIFEIRGEHKGESVMVSEHMC